MAYCTIDDLRQSIPDDVLADLSDDAEGDVSDEQILAGLAESASSLMDSYFRPHYAVPLSSPVPAIVVQYACFIAIYYIFSRQGLVEDTAEDTVRVNYEDAIKWLEGVRDGKTQLPVDPPSPEAQVRFEGNERVFTRETLRGR